MKKSKIINIVLITTNILFMAVIALMFYLPTVNSPQRIFKTASTFVIELKAESGVGTSYGSGVIINQDGKIITNAHVVTYSQAGEINTFDTYWARFINQEDYLPLTLLNYDTDKDLAILQFTQEQSNLSYATMSSTALETGDTVYAVGNSQNYGISLTQGIISIPRINSLYEEQEKTVIQSDLIITAGNSGGALLNSKGQLIGITTFRTKDLQGNIVYGLAYSIPNDIITSYINEQ